MRGEGKGAKVGVTRSEGGSEEAEARVGGRMGKLKWKRESGSEQD